MFLSKVFKQSTLKEPWPVVVCPYCVSLLYTLFCFKVEEQEINNKIKKLINKLQ